MAKYNTRGIKMAPGLFQHPADRAACKAIKASDAFRKALAFISSNSLEKYLNGIYSSSMLQLTPENAPVIYEMIDEAKEMFGEKRDPIIFTERRYSFKTGIEGIEKVFVRASTECLYRMDETTLWIWISGIISAVKSGYGEIGFINTLCLNSAGILPDIVVKSMSLLLDNWRKYAQLSIDRAGLVASGDINAVIRNIYLDYPPELLDDEDLTSPDCRIYKQAMEFANNENAIEGVAWNIYSVLRKDSYRSFRYLELLKFYKEEYPGIISLFE